MLVIEDEAMHSMFIKNTLLDAGVGRVTCAQIVSAARAEIGRTKFDMIFLDVNLADRNDGWCIATIVSELAPRRPLIFYSTAQPDSIPKCASAYGQIVGKSFTTEDIFKAIGAG